MGITIHDVATAAGVSPATVSRVLAGGNSVAPKTAERVRQVIEWLGYRPDRVAQSLRRQRSGMMGLVLPIDLYPASDMLIRHLERCLAIRDMSLLLADTTEGTDHEAQQRLVSQGVDALFMVRVSPSQDPLGVSGQSTPVILIDSGRASGDIDSVRVDHGAGIRQVVRFLAREGASRPAFVGEGSASHNGTQQLEAFAEVTSSIPELLTTAIRLGPPTAEFARSVIAELACLDAPPDAYVCGSDIVAATISKLLHREHPLSALVVGYGGKAWCGLLSPELTTVDLPVQALAEEALRLASRRLDGLQAGPNDIALPPSLTVRESA